MMMMIATLKSPVDGGFGCYFVLWVQVGMWRAAGRFLVEGDAVDRMH